MGLFDKLKKKKPDEKEGKTAEIFEDAFSAIQTDMVQICLEYVDNRADKIFLKKSYKAGAGSLASAFCLLLGDNLL